MDVRQAVVDDALLAALLEGLLTLARGAFFLLWLLGCRAFGGRFVLRHRQITFFFAIAPLRGPLRVRALVLVRWPRTGRPRRCRSPRKQPISISRLMFMEISLRRSPSTPPCSSITRLMFRTSSSDRSLIRISGLTPASVRILFERTRPMP